MTERNLSDFDSVRDEVEAAETENSEIRDALRWAIQRLPAEAAAELQAMLAERCVPDSVDELEWQRDRLHEIAVTLRGAVALSMDPPYPWSVAEAIRELEAFRRSPALLPEDVA